MYRDIKNLLVVRKIGGWLRAVTSVYKRKKIVKHRTYKEKRVYKRTEL
jgi:hypothetical protein